MKQNIAKKGDGYDKATGDFWDMVQGKGTRLFYEYGFANSYFEYIHPKYKIIPTSRSINMFDTCKYLKKVESAYFDFTNAVMTSGNYAIFRSCSELVEIEDINIQSGNYTQTYRNCPKLERIAIMRVAVSNTFDGVFDGDVALKNIAIEGTIGQSGLSFSDCPLLTGQSVDSIIQALDITTPGTTKTITFNIANKQAYCDYLEVDIAYWDSWASFFATEYGWTISVL